MLDHKFDIYGFRSVPFMENITSPFLDAAREKVFGRIRNFLLYRGFAVLSGAPGTGKTMLLNHVCRSLPPKKHKIIYIPFGMLKPADMLRNICMELDLEPTMSTAKMLYRIQARVRGMQPVNPILVLDEIQQISHQTMETVRLMTNFSFEEKNIFSVIMAGGDEFFSKLRLKINEPLRQRITSFNRLSALSRENTTKYLEHHFKVAGVHHQVITEQAANLIYDKTTGIPRLVNSLAFASLEEAADEGAKLVDIEQVEKGSQRVIFPAAEVFK